jgi:CRISPR/Cas system-associated protein endoribonuclease Cas2
VEDASADTVAAKKFVQQMQHITEEGGYSLQQISISNRLLCSGKRWLQGLTSLERKNQHLHLRLPQKHINISMNI